MAGFEFTLEVNAPIEVMWEVMTDHERWSDWMPSSKVVLDPEGSPDRNGMGAVRNFMVGKIATAREEVIGWEPPGCAEEEKLGEKVEGTGGDASMTYCLLSQKLMKDYKSTMSLTADTSDSCTLTWQSKWESVLPDKAGGNITQSQIKKMLHKTAVKMAADAAKEAEGRAGRPT